MHIVAMPGLREMAGTLVLEKAEILRLFTQQVAKARDAGGVEALRTVSERSNDVNIQRAMVRVFRAGALPLRCWNWKAALLSVTMRSVALFCFVDHGAGDRLQAALHAGLVEAAHVSLTAGVYASLQQRSLGVRPRWLGNVLIVAGVPMGAQAVDYLLQKAAGTPHMQAASLGMVGWGLLSALFHLHLMRHGSMLVGEGAGTLRSDLRRMPRLVVLFVAAPVMALAGKGARSSNRQIEHPGLSG